MATSSKFDIDVPFTKIDGLCVHSKVITADGLEEVKGFEFESGDLLSVTYPKAGQSKTIPIHVFVLSNPLMRMPLYSLYFKFISALNGNVSAHIKS